MKGLLLLLSNIILELSGTCMSFHNSKRTIYIKKTHIKKVSFSSLSQNQIKKTCFLTLNTSSNYHGRPALWVLLGDMAAKSSTWRCKITTGRVGVPAKVGDVASASPKTTYRTNLKTVWNS